MMKLTLLDVEVGTKIRGKYLVRLEAGDYQHLPNDIFTRGFVRNYGEFLGLDGEALAKRYETERGGVPQPNKPKIRPIGTTKIVVTPRLLAGLVTVAVVGLIGAYLVWQLSFLSAAPKLTIDTPAEDQVIFGSVVDVGGQVGSGADLYINNSPVLTDSNGKFTDKVALTDGLNVITVTAKNRLGKTTVLSRNILAHLPKLEAAQTNVPEATFDGVAVAVSIGDAAVGLVIEVDGREVFRGTMLAGTSQLFKGATVVRVTTLDGGRTGLLITNQVVARKEIKPLGSIGEIKRNLEFAKDTQFP